MPNLAYMLKEYGITVHYNVIKKTVKICLPKPQTFADNGHEASLTEIISLAALNDFYTPHLPGYVAALAEANPYNPVAEWIHSKPWDGQDRIQAIVSTIVAREGFPQALKHALIYKWLLSCVAAATMDKGFKARGVLTLQGPQSCGKTSWLLALVPDPELGPQVIKADHHLDANQKDSVLTAITHWIVEIGELDSSFKKDIARLKGFLTSDQDKLRRPYGKTDSEYARSTVFSATVNADDFLVDLTGNTRFWTVPVESLNFRHGIDMQQVFAQLEVRLKEGEVWWLTKDEESLLEEHNDDHMSASSIKELLMQHIDPRAESSTIAKYIGAAELLRELDFKEPSNGQAKECAAILRQLFGPPKKIKGSMKWRVPLVKQNFADLPSPHA